MSTLTFNPATRQPLNPDLYNLPQYPDALAFFKSQTGIIDDDELKKHIIQVQEKAYDIHAYPCIWTFNFLRLKIARLPAYPQALALLHKHTDPLLLDIGCCFGNDARKAVVDGWPVKNVIASDLRGDFWTSGHELFKSTPESFPVTFIEGDVFDPAFIAPADPIYDKCPSQRPEGLHQLQTLTPLQGQISAIHASSLFHLFDEEGQTKAARQVATLLSPEAGSLIFGSHIGKTDKGSREVEESIPVGRARMFCHSPESWRELWDGGVFKKGSVTVQVTVDKNEIPRKEGPVPIEVMSWSVTRV
ncbi:hypothetical protein BKA70DRAFT_1421562 [Coprinopsis sp. MPI-PUGE-AT-0042]|nr:hypothetical protein BKA70DRAFT_1421562 [Coprinopsis sp. MPI-PUGE-AT-0042]